MSSNCLDRTGPLERTLLAFFVLAASSCVVVYLAALLLLHPAPTERYPAPVTLALVGILLVIAVGMVGVVRHWRKEDQDTCKNLSL
jgi:ABC-type nickel/cobalt efflux system permease component RcnA